MCGRFTLTIDAGQAARTIMGTNAVEIPSDLASGPRYNIAPTQDIAAVVAGNGTGPTPRLEMLRWGLIPSWAKEENIGSRMINARAETLAEKPSFKRLLHNRRCLIMADGFYEWRQEPGSKAKTPMYITLQDHEPFTFAGLWDSWRAPDGRELHTCTIITTSPNDLMSQIHNRMPAILPREARELWLDPTLKDAQILLPLLVAYHSSEMTARPVSRQVNDPRLDRAELIA